MKRYIIPLGIVALVVILRTIAPSILLEKINSELKEQSPTILLEAGDLDLKLFRAGMVLQNIEGKIKENKTPFLKVKEVSTFLNWKSLLKGEVVAKIKVDNPDITYSPALTQALETHQKLTEKEKEKELPEIEIKKINVENIFLRMTLLPELTEAEGLIVKNGMAQVINAIPGEKSPFTYFSFEGRLLDAGSLPAYGAAKINDDPPRWKINSELLGFNLSSLNRFLKEKVPLTFEKGELDFYMEAKSEESKISGYLKPFIKDLKVIETGEEFEGPKHWFFEVVTALTNVLMKSKSDVAATKVSFEYDEGVEIDKSKIIKKAIEHAYFDELTPGIEESIQLK